jgi:uncharacterized 2Fe-2S/4Fe-4S cluster protein (DUF4445 family)
MQITLTTGATLEISEKESLLRALKRQGVYLVASCGGKGICGKCRIRLIKGECDTKSTGKLDPRDVKSGISLACQTFPKTDITINIPKESQLIVGDKIALSKSGNLLDLLRSFDVPISPVVRNIVLDLPPPTIDDNISDLARLNRSLEEKGIIGTRFFQKFVSNMSDVLRDARWKINLGYTVAHDIVYITPADKKKESYGIAVDIGTTTVVVYLVDLVSGQLVDVGSTYNSQIRYGDDVINRIVYAVESGGLEELRESVVTDINSLVGLLRERHNIEREDIESAVIAGNTTMTHIFWGINLLLLERSHMFHQ